MNSKFRWHNFSDGKPNSGDAPVTSEIGGPSVKKCTNGKSCSATCVANDQECLLDLSPEIQKSLERVVKKLNQSSNGEK